jgi:uncharacterized coiled-coil protein SlyX
MPKMKIRSLLMAGAVAGLAMGVAGQAGAQSASDQIKAQQAQIDYMKRQIELMQQKLQDLQNTTQATQKESQEVAAAVAKATPPKGKKGVQIGAVTVTPGGFLAAEGVLREKTQGADIGEALNGAPFPNSSNYHLSEDRFTARQSRLSLLAIADIDPTTHVAGYYEMDFLGAAATANSKESNSYNLRIRNIYSTVDWDDIGLHLLAGQSWSLATLYSKGLTPRQEDTPLTIDSQYVTGFNWLRVPGVRVVQDLIPNQMWLGVSVENAQLGGTTGTFSSAAGYQVVSSATGGGGNFDTDTGGSTYSNDAAPDVIAKLAWEPGWGHYEIYGVARFFRDRANFQDKTTVGGGVGGGAILPVIPKMLDVQVSGLVGKGIGRYGSAQLPDVTFNSNGSIHPMSEYAILAGVIAHPTTSLDIYGYGGLEHADRWYQNIGGTQYGYGDPLANNSGCFKEGGTCTANTRDAMEGTVGFWWKFYQGDFGSVRWGAQYAYIARNIWSGANGGPGLAGGGTADNNMIFTSFRYYPF